MQPGKWLIEESVMLIINRTNQQRPFKAAFLSVLNGLIRCLDFFPPFLKGSCNISDSIVSCNIRSVQVKYKEVGIVGSFFKGKNEWVTK